MPLDARLAVSNLAWTADLDAAAFACLAELGVEGVEVAPTRIAGWDELTPSRLRSYRDRLTDCGLQVSSLQAILFAVEGAHLLGDEMGFSRFRAQLERVAEVGSILGASVAVFGAPRNRLLHDWTPEEATALAFDRLSMLGPVFQTAGLILGIEPVPAHYGGEFLTHISEVASLVHGIGHPAIRLHLDTGCAYLGGESIADAIVRHAEILSHFHAAEPDLAGFSTPTSDHGGAAAALQAVGYRRWVSIEMKPQAPDPLAAMKQAVRSVRGAYFEAPSDIGRSGKS